MLCAKHSKCCETPESEEIPLILNIILCCTRVGQHRSFSESMWIRFFELLGWQAVKPLETACSAQADGTSCQSERQKGGWVVELSGWVVVAKCCDVAPKNHHHEIDRFIGSTVSGIHSVSHFQDTHPLYDEHIFNIKFLPQVDSFKCRSGRWNGSTFERLTVKVGSHLTPLDSKILGIYGWLSHRWIL